MSQKRKEIDKKGLELERNLHDFFDSLMIRIDNKCRNPKATSINGEIEFCDYCCIVKRTLVIIQIKNRHSNKSWSDVHGLSWQGEHQTSEERTRQRKISDIKNQLEQSLSWLKQLTEFQPNWLRDSSLYDRILLLGVANISGQESLDLNERSDYCLCYIHQKSKNVDLHILDARFIRSIRKNPVRLLEYLKFRKEFITSQSTQLGNVDHDLYGAFLNPHYRKKIKALMKCGQVCLSELFRESI